MTNFGLIRKILIANRGLCAYKFCVSIRDMCVERGIDVDLYGICTDNDLTSKYKYIAHVTYTIFHSGDDSIYMDGPGLVALCREHGIDAVYPGWGYLSESAEFARLCADNGIIFIGPTAETIEQLGNKIHCMRLAQDLDVPTLAWSGPQPLRTYEDVAMWADRIGFPVVLKDADGGGGKGIRVVRARDDLEDSYNAILLECAARDAANVFVMKLAERCRHLEVQIVGDGNDYVHLFGRDCTMQRRNQKIFEEGPVTILPHARVEAMQDCALRLARAVQFRGVCTAEFLYEPETDTLTFLEINPRLQVEHIVTEMITGVNLPAVQYHIACGVKIRDIPDLAARPAVPLCHVVAARVNAEDWSNEFRPATGIVQHIEHDHTQTSWAYFSVESGGRILSTTDNQFGHVFARGRDRATAIAQLRRTLEHVHVACDFSCNLGFLKHAVASADFQHNTHHTQWALGFARTLPQRAPGGGLNEILCGLITAAHLQHAAHTQTQNALRAKGHVPDERPRFYPAVLASPFQPNVRYNVSCHFTDGRVILNPNNANTVFYSVPYFEKGGSLFYYFGKKMYRVRVLCERPLRIAIFSGVYVFPEDVDPSVVVSHCGGRLVKWHVRGGDSVRAGDALYDAEAMKMVFTIRATHAGTIELCRRDGETIAAGDVLARLRLVDGGGACAVETGFADTGALNFLERAAPQDVSRCFERDILRKTRSQLLLSKRQQAAALDTTYVYDLVRMFIAHRKEQLRFDSVNDTVSRGDINESCDDGMLGFLLTYTLHGREVSVVVIANDILVDNGTFDARCAAQFVAYSRFARQHGYARVYVSCNSGARLDTRAMDAIKDYVVYDADCGELYVPAEALAGVRAHVEGELRGERFYLSRVLHDSVAYLDGCGHTASETCAAYNDIFTITYVTGRAVGIGAYLARLGARVVQRADAPLVLTGHKSLNKVIGQDMYQSNLQLGGPQVMAANGITGVVVQTDAEGVRAIERWLYYAACPSIDAVPAKMSREPRVCEERVDALVDAHTFFETMAEYAPSVLTGRARIGGRAFGLVVANDGPSVKRVPLDPADLSTSNVEKPQSGRVWYADSSFKTAQTIRDCRRERLPLAIVADWRGFSGGTQDMYDAVLKFGSMIVDELHDYPAPVFVLLYPGAQLRGGAMVVLARAINPAHIHVLADPRARINVLEPDGLAEIKVRDTDLRAWVARGQARDDTEAALLARRMCELQEHPTDSGSVRVLPHGEFREYIQRVMQAVEC